MGPFVYLRLHGPQRYSGRYPVGMLEEWAEWCVVSLSQGMSVYVYLDNDVGGHAPKDALRLRDLSRVEVNRRPVPDRNRAESRSLVPYVIGRPDQLTLLPRGPAHHKSGADRTSSMRSRLLRSVLGTTVASRW